MGDRHAVSTHVELLELPDERDDVVHEKRQVDGVHFQGREGPVHDRRGGAVCDGVSDDAVERGLRRKRAIAIEVNKIGNRELSQRALAALAKRCERQEASEFPREDARRNAALAHREGDRRDVRLLQERQQLQVVSLIVRRANDLRDVRAGLYDAHDDRRQIVRRLLEVVEAHDQLRRAALGDCVHRIQLHVDIGHPGLDRGGERPDAGGLAPAPLAPFPHGAGGHNRSVGAEADQARHVELVHEIEPHLDQVRHLERFVDRSKSTIGRGLGDRNGYQCSSCFFLNA